MDSWLFHILASEWGDVENQSHDWCFYALNVNLWKKKKE